MLLELTATQARIVVEIGAGSETLGAKTSARSLGKNFGTVYGNASTLLVSSALLGITDISQSRHTQDRTVQLDKLLLVLRVDLSWSVSPLWQDRRLDLPREAIFQDDHHASLRTSQEPAQSSISQR